MILSINYYYNLELSMHYTLIFVNYFVTIFVKKWGVRAKSARYNATPAKVYE
jgi:hypothetical protein